MLRKIQEKASNKLSKTRSSQTSYHDNEKKKLDHHFRNIAQGMVRDFFWNFICSKRETFEKENQIVIVGTLGKKKGIDITNPSLKRSSFGTEYTFSYNLHGTSFWKKYKFTELTIIFGSRRYQGRSIRVNHCDASYMGAFE